MPEFRKCSIRKLTVGLGLIFIIGRIVYCRAYLADPAKRGAGFGLTMLATTVLLLGGLGGALWLVVAG